MNRHVLPVLTPGTDPGVLPPGMFKRRASPMMDVWSIRQRIDELDSPPLPPKLPSEPRTPLSWDVAKAAVDAPDELNLDIQSTVARVLLDNTRSPDQKRRRDARKLAATFSRRPDLTPSIRESLIEARRINLFPVVVRRLTR